MSRNPTHTLLKVIMRGQKGPQAKQWEAFARLFSQALDDAYEDGFQAALEVDLEHRQHENHGQPVRRH